MNPSDFHEIEQGVQMPCVRCTILGDPDPSCPDCGGSSWYFREAHMCDLPTQQKYGRLARQNYDELSGRQDWDRLAVAIPECLRGLVMYGPGWASGFLGVDPEAAAKRLESLKMELRDAYVAAKSKS
jgi:hypothetical protein